MIENLKMALESLRTNKMRSILTMLGIIIGIAAVIAIMSMGNALTGMVNSMLGQFGAYNVTLAVEDRKKQDRTANDSQVTRTPEDKDLMSYQELETMVEKFPGKVEAFTISTSSLPGQVKDGRLYANTLLQGIDEGFKEVNDLTINSGSFFTQSDFTDKRKVCLISDKVADKVFNGQDIIGKPIRVYLSSATEEYTVIGIYKYEMKPGMLMSADQTSVFIPMTTWTLQNGGNKNFQSASLKIAKDADMNAVTQELNTYWDQIYYKNPQWRIDASNMQSIIDQSLQTVGIMQGVLGVIGGISLLVGGIGVMNIMLVSVTERTREIGIRKALGARQGQILFQFVTEGGILSLIGGFIGLILGFIMGQVGASAIASMSNMTGINASLSPIIIVGTLVFSIGIGVGFGLYPAYKASRLDPIDALRYE